MYRLTTKLIIYRNIPKDSILFRLAEISKSLRDPDVDRERLTEETLTEIHRLLSIATKYGFDGNLWHNYLAYTIATTEAPFTLVCEKVGAPKGSVEKFAKNDLAVFRAFFDYDFSPWERKLGLDVFTTIENYQATPKREHIYNKSVSLKVQELSASLRDAKTPDGMYKAVTEFYRRYGVGMLGLNKAFRLSPNPDSGILLEPITNTGDIKLSDIVGYESQKERILANTEAFVSGRGANNVLLYGDAGTGKSTCIKGLMTEFYDRGLRMIELYKHEFRYLSRIIAYVKNRNYRFIIYMDDLSFEEFEIEYKYLKAVIEGGLEAKPDNVLIYATSNRRHLIRETWADRPDNVNEDMHQMDTVQEKLSLAERFGLTIGFFRPDQENYFAIVRALAAKENIPLSDEELIAGARRFSMSHSGFSGRTARQYIISQRPALDPARSPL